MSLTCQTVQTWLHAALLCSVSRIADSFLHVSIADTFLHVFTDSCRTSHQMSRLSWVRRRREPFCSMA